MDNNLNSESNDILIEQYNNYKNVLNEMEELEKNDFENDTSTLYTLKNVVRPKTKVALQFYFNLKFLLLSALANRTAQEQLPEAASIQRRRLIPP